MSDETIYNAEWDGLCVRCGCHVADAWTALCSRCQQLLALEAEIGRAAIGASIRAGIYYNLDTKQFNNDAIRAAELVADTEVQHELPRLIARWRRLHAEGAE